MSLGTLPLDLGTWRVTIDPTAAGVLADLFGSGAPALLTRGWLPPFAELAAINPYLFDSKWFDRIGLADGGRVLQLSQQVSFDSATPVDEELELNGSVVGWYALGHLDVVEVLLHVRSAASGKVRSTWRGAYTIDGSGRAPGGVAQHRRTRGPRPTGAALATAAVTFDAPEVARFAGASGDINPIHLDPGAARAAGFDRPIVHGCLTLAVAAALAVAANGGGGIRLRSASASFRQPIHWGERVDLQVFGVSAAGVHPLRCSVGGRAALRSTWVEVG